MAVPRPSRTGVPQRIVLIPDHIGISAEVDRETLAGAAVERTVPRRFSKGQLSDDRACAGPGVGLLYGKNSAWVLVDMLAVVAGVCVADPRDSLDT